MKKLLASLALLASCVEPALAQSDTASLRRIIQLEAYVAKLQMIVGAPRWDAPQIPCSVLDANRPTFTFINGEYDLAFRNRQFGCAFDPLVNRVAALETATPPNTDGLQTQITGLAARVAAIESSVAGGQPVGTAVFDRVRANKVCIGDLDCDGDWNADLQIRKNTLANIGMESNLSHVDPQDPSHTHVSQFNVSLDGGTRIQQNAKSTYSRGFVSNVNPCRAWLNFGPDSRSSVSIFVGSVNEETHPTAPCTPIPHDGAQDFVFLTDEVNRRSVIFLSRPNWKLEFKLSSTIHAGDISIVPAPQP